MQISTGYKSQYTPFDRFLNSLHTEATKKTYTKSLKYFLRFTNLGEDFSDLITKLTDDDQRHEVIADYITFIKNNRKNSPSTINIALLAIKKFYAVNRIRLDWEYLANFKGKTHGKIIDDRLYTREEIDKLLLHADLREKVVIHTLLSTGMRVGGLAEIRFKDLIPIPEFKLYKFKVYATSQNNDEKYITFCTPECANLIDKYLEYRVTREGDNIKPDSPLIYRKLTRYDNRNKRTVYINQFDIPLGSEGLQQVLSRLQRRSAVAPKQKEDLNNPGRIRKEMMRCHAFRKMFNTTCIKNNMNYNVKERLMGHKKEQALDFNYFRPDDEMLLIEYLKVVNDLTISNEFRLKVENEELHEKLDRLEEDLKPQLDNVIKNLQERGFM